tara:strand:+ start:1982 stop:2230 length:249 start_codon:yes stop_codon:yes gene_type:complete
MLIIIRRAVIFFVIACLISFVLIPAFQIYVGGVPKEEVMTVIDANLNGEKMDIWKKVFTYNLGLWGGKAMLWALNTAVIRKP